MHGWNPWLSASRFLPHVYSSIHSTHSTIIAMLTEVTGGEKKLTWTHYLSFQISLPVILLFFLCLWQSEDSDGCHNIAQTDTGLAERWKKCVRTGSQGLKCLGQLSTLNEFLDLVHPKTDGTGSST